MTCNNCHSPDCLVDVSERMEGEALETYGYSDEHDAACEAMDKAQRECASRRINLTRTVKPRPALAPDDLLARIGAIEARQDRIEAMLIAKGYEL